ncbi:hypothetical protein [Planococcus chinensis]|uniref:YhfM-like domain-containing protein n=1 Tax=Planococcus chinensis TaxID=272917 RepID=A0ABW4QKW3_9BACL
MKKLLIQPIIFGSLLFAACIGEEKQADSIGTEIAEAAETDIYGKVKATPVFEVIDKEHFESFQKALDGAVKIEGTVNMSTPHAKILHSSDSYFLWFNENNTATLMDATDTHTIYTVFAVSKIKEMIGAGNDSD